jgi:uncharacterized protein (TIGR02588 family)
MAEMSRDIDETDENRRADRIEWVIGGIASLIVLAMVVFLVYQGANDAGSPPELRVEVERSVDFAETGHVRFAVFNSGGTAAGHVVVSAVERGPDGSVAVKHTVEIDYVPAHSTESGGLYVDPEAELVFRIDGYVDP